MTSLFCFVCYHKFDVFLCSTLHNIFLFNNITVRYKF